MLIWLPVQCIITIIIIIIAFVSILFIIIIIISTAKVSILFIISIIIISMPFTDTCDCRNLIFWNLIIIVFVFTSENNSQIFPIILNLNNPSWKRLTFFIAN